MTNHYNQLLWGIFFLLGGFVVWIASPSEPRIEADLVVWTTNAAIYVPITKEKAREFSTPGIQVIGISVKGRQSP